MPGDCRVLRVRQCHLRQPCTPNGLRQFRDRYPRHEAIDENACEFFARKLELQSPADECRSAAYNGNRRFLQFGICKEQFFGVPARVCERGEL